MAEDKDWFARQASRTAEDIKQLPEWMRTQRDTPKSDQSSGVQEPNKDQNKVSA
jgi:hypothetical protein